MSFNITPVASGYQEIHPYSAMNIDSVKINTSLIMMKEWVVSHLNIDNTMITISGQHQPSFGLTTLRRLYDPKFLIRLWAGMGKAPLCCVWQEGDFHGERCLSSAHFSLDSGFSIR